MNLKQNNYINIVDNFNIIEIIISNLVKNNAIFKKCEEDHFTTLLTFDYIDSVLAKSSAEPENSNYLLMANSTPKACFFIRSTRTPKERLERLSMVACSGKGFALCCVPLVAVSQPVTRYRPKPENFQAVTSSNLLMELSAMIYLFKAVSRLDLRNTQKPFTSFPRYTIKVQAESIEQAQARISRLFAVLSVSTVTEGGLYA